jgi:prefoldin subunit 5
MSAKIALQHRIIMKERLRQLQAEYEEGRRQMALLDRRRQDLRDTLLRIRGAIQILEELAANGAVEGQSQVSNAARPPDRTHMMAS